MSISIRPVAHDTIAFVVSALVELLRESVHAGASLGFVPPMTRTEGRDYWLSLRPDLAAGSRVLLAAYADDRIVGSGQLVLPAWPNARHCAELHKLFVSNALQRQVPGRRSCPRCTTRLEREDAHSSSSTLVAATHPSASTSGWATAKRA